MTIKIVKREFNNACDCPECGHLTHPHAERYLSKDTVHTQYLCPECDCEWDRKMEPANVY